MKAFIVVFLLFGGIALADAPYYRFWRGVKRAEFTWEDFNEKVNRWLIPATTSCCAQSSLTAYLPVLTPRGPKPNGIHDEIALIVYRSEAAYQKTRNDKDNKEAIAYGPLHGDVFDMENKKSLSLVPLPYKGMVTSGTEAAYDVLETSPDWQKGNVWFRLSLRPTRLSDEQYADGLKKHFDSMKKTEGLKGYLVLVAPTYLIEYLNWEKDPVATSALETLLGKPYQSVAVLPRAQVKEASPLRYEPLSFAEAATIQFTPGEKPNPPAHHPRLDATAR